MANTTNYNWETPDDTDLVKDGAAAIRTLGSSIDTTVFNNANAAIAKSIIDAKGDLISATAADTPARLAVGTNGQILAANSSTSTGLEWQTITTGGMTELATGSLSGLVVSLTSISGAYKDLVLVLRDPSVSGDGNRALMMYFNNDQSSLYHSYTSPTAPQTGLAATSAEITITPTILASSTNGLCVVTIFDYANTACHKIVNRTGFVESAATPTFSTMFGNGLYRSTSAISRIDINSIGGSSTLAGTYILYGVK